MNKQLFVLSLLFTFGCSAPRKAEVNGLMINELSITRHVALKADGIESITYYSGTKIIGSGRTRRADKSVKSTFIINLPSLGSISGVYAETIPGSKSLEVSIAKLHDGFLCSVNTGERTITFFPAKGAQQLTIFTDSAGTPVFPAFQQPDK